MVRFLKWIASPSLRRPTASTISCINLLSPLSGVFSIWKFFAITLSGQSVPSSSYGKSQQEVSIFGRCDIERRIEATQIICRESSPALQERDEPSHGSASFFY